MATRVDKKVCHLKNLHDSLDKMQNENLIEVLYEKARLGRIGNKEESQKSESARNKTRAQKIIHVLNIKLLFISRNYKK